MIGRITGELVWLKPPVILVEVSGIGYEIDLPMSDCAELPCVGNKVVLYTHLVIREDAHLLYGFLTVSSRDCFRQLIKVSGVGPRIGLALLSTLNLEEINLALNSGNISLLCRTPGIGKKVAERLILELKGKSVGNTVYDKSSKDLSPCYLIRADIANALTSLGYKDKDAMEVVKRLPLDIIDLSWGIKEALKLLNEHRSL